MASPSIVALMSILEAAEQAARDALSNGTMADHMYFGRVYHETADRLVALGASDPRPTH